VGKIQFKHRGNRGSREINKLSIATLNKNSPKYTPKPSSFSATSALKFPTSPPLVLRRIKHRDNRVIRVGMWISTTWVTKPSHTQTKFTNLNPSAFSANSALKLPPSPSLKSNHRFNNPFLFFKCSFQTFPQKEILIIEGAWGEYTERSMDFRPNREPIRRSVYCAALAAPDKNILLT
jgi:hypothetical protein